MLQFFLATQQRYKKLYFLAALQKIYNVAKFQIVQRCNFFWQHYQKKHIFVHFLQRLQIQFTNPHTP